jgi:hypothetical protein
MLRKFSIFFLIMIIALSSCGKAVPVTSESVAASPPPPMPEQAAEPVATSPPVPEPTANAEQVPAYNDYNVALDINPVTRIVHGIQRFNFTNRSGRPLTNVVMRIYLNAFKEDYQPAPYFADFSDRIFLNGIDYGYINILSVSVETREAEFATDGTVLTIQLSEALEPDQTTQINLQFEAYVPKIAHRTGANDNAMWCGMFLPVLAVHDGDRWRTDPYYPAGDPFMLDTANFTVEITTPPEYFVAGCGLMKEELLEDKKVTTYTAKLTRDFAFAVSDKYKTAETVTAAGITVRLYYYTEAIAIDAVLDAAKRSIEYFEQTVGTYPFLNGNICIVETDMFVSGVEFSKIVFMDSARLMQTQDFYNLMHQMGHQWFYNVVGSDQINEPWLDEGLIMYVQERLGHATEEEYLTKLANDYEIYINRGGQALADGIGAYESWADYYNIHYSKAKLMFYALNRLIGDEAFWQCVRQYYQTYSFRIATGADFISTAEQAYGESLTDFFDEWLKGDVLPRINN